MSVTVDGLNSSMSSPRKMKAWERLYQNSIDKQLMTLDSASTCASPSPRRRRTFVELDLLVRHEVSKVKKRMLEEQSLSTAISECSHKPKINAYSELIALKLVEKEKKVLEEIAVPKCFVNIKKEVHYGKIRPRTAEEEIVSKGLSPVFRRVSYKAGCDVAKMAEVTKQKKVRFGLLKAK